jgi:hypothetical protein
MSYTQLAPQPAPRADDAQPVAPGLWPNEVAVNLTDINADAAVGVEIRWLENNAGAEFHAWARAISADGTTQLSPHADEVVTETRHTCSPTQMATYGAPALSREHVLLVLGEPPTMVDVTGPDGSGGTQTTSEPMIAWADDLRANCSIRHALTAVASAGDVTDLASLL